MQAEAPKPPARKPPALSSDRPKPAASSGKAPTAPVIQDEDLGHGCSKEEAIEKVGGFFSASAVAKFEDAKWNVKVEGFTDLQNEIQEKQPTPDILEAVAKFVKARMKDWKESNVNLQKAIVAIFNFMALNCERMSKRTLHCAMQFFTDKIGDVKLSAAIKEMLLNCSELVTPKFVALQIIKYAATAKAPNTIKDSCLFLADLADNFGPSALPLKEAIDFGKVGAAHATPAVRQAAMKLFQELYRHVGEIVRNFLDGIKESTLKVIDAELQKCTQYGKGEFEKKRSVRGEATEQEEAAGAGKKGKGGGGGGAADDLLASLPREDISKKLTSKMMEQFKHKDWKIRKKGGEDVEGLLREAKMRIEPNGVGELMDAMKNGMKDPNKAVVKVFINLLGLLAVAIGAPIKQYTKKCFVPMLNNISDKQSLVRADVVASMNKWAEAIGAEIIINHVATQLTVENPESRTEGLKWIDANSEAIPKADVKEMVKPLIACLTDKSKAIREASENIIKEIMPIVGYPEFLGGIKDHKTAVQQTLKPILEKLKGQCGSAPAQEEAKQSAVQRAKSPAPVKKEEAKKPGGSFGRAALDKKRDGSASRRPVTAPASRKPAADDDSVSINVIPKAKRQLADQRNKYPINEVKGDHIDKLKGYTEEIFGQKYHDQMWAKSGDFGKHIKCVEQLDAFVKTHPEDLLEIIDVVFKWCNVRLTESSNTKLLISVLDFFGSILQYLIDTGRDLLDFQMIVLLGTLCDKAGTNNKILVEKVKNLMKMCLEVYEKKLCVRMIIDTGVKSKNLKSVAECLDEIAAFVAKNGIDTITKKDYAVFLGCVDNSDKNVRENGLRVFAEIYKSLAEDVWRMLPKDVNIKVKGMLEARFKQIQKGGGMNASINSAKGNLNLTGSKKRQSVAPASLNSTGLKFKPPAEPEVEKISQEESVNTKMQNFDPFESKNKLQEEQKAPEEADMQAVFQGKQLPDDAEMVDQAGEPSAEVIMAKHKSGQSASAHETVQPQNDGKVANVPPAQAQNLMREDDAMVQQMLQDAEDNLDVDPALKEQQAIIMNHIHQLKNGDLLKRVDSLVALNELISSGNGQQADQLSGEQQVQQTALIKSCDQLIGAFTFVMSDILSHPVNDIPLRFTKYFITIVNKTCASKEIMREVTEDCVFKLAEQLLTRLLIENLDKVGPNKEGELILKNLNSSMLRMLENCNHTYIFVVLFTLLKNYKDDASMPKLGGLIIKCLLKLSKIMEKLIDTIDLAKFLVAIHEYLCVIDHDNKSQNDDLGIRIVKTLVNEVVKLKRDAIWQSYEVIKNHAQPDKHIERWIQIIIKSLPPGERQAQATGPVQDVPQQPSQQNPVVEVKTAQPTQSRMYMDFEMKKIIQDLKDPHKIEAGIQKLDKFSKANPTYEFAKNLQKEGQSFASTILGHLEAHRNGNSWKSTNDDSMGASGHAQDKVNQLKQKLNSVHQAQDLNKSLSKMSAFESKMSKFQSRKSAVVDGSDAKRSSMVGAGQQSQNNLNTSFSALNNSLSQKWAAINSSGPKKFGGLTGRPQTAQTGMLAQTITPGMGGTNALNTSNNKFQSKMQGGFANRLQNKQAPGTQKPTSSQVIGQGSPSKIAASQSTTQIGAGSALKRNSNAGGVSTNSFRSRLQGFGTSTQPAQPGPGASATNQDLQKRLADMKAKLQGIKK